MEKVRKIGLEDRVAAAPTPGMFREEALAGDGFWAGFATTDARMASGWHHHGEHDSVIYVLSGILRMESGPGGGDVVEAMPGDFIHIPRHAIHRESNPSDEEGRIVVFRSGTGLVVTNVDGPEQG